MSSEVAPVKTDGKVVSLATLKPNQIVGTADMRRLVGDLTPILAKSLPMHLKQAVDRVGASLVVEMTRSEYVAKATARSLLGGLVQVAQLGLELGGPLGQCFLVPFFCKGVYEAQFVCGYKGLIKLAFNAGVTREFDAHPVHEGDEFDIGLGSNPFVMHKPTKKGLRTADNLIGVYGYAHLKDAEHPALEWMTVDELKAHRDRYTKARGDSSPWQTAFVQMCVKTVLRRLGKTLPASAEMNTACSLDEMDDANVRQNLAANLAPLIDYQDQTPRSTEVAEAIGAGSHEDGLDASDIPR